MCVCVRVCVCALSHFIVRCPVSLVLTHFCVSCPNSLVPCPFFLSCCPLSHFSCPVSQSSCLCGAVQDQWTFVNGLMENAVYGGRVDNDFDMNILKSFLQIFFNNAVICGKVCVCMCVCVCVCVRAHVCMRACVCNKLYMRLIVCMYFV